MNRNILQAEVILDYCRAFAGKKAVMVFVSLERAKPVAEYLLGKMNEGESFDLVLGVLKLPNGSVFTLDCPETRKASVDLIWIEEEL